MGSPWGAFCQITLTSCLFLSDKRNASMRFVELYNNNNKLSLILSVSLFLCGTDISAEMPPIDRRRESLSSGQVFCPILVSIYQVERGSNGILFAQFIFMFVVSSSLCVVETRPLKRGEHGCPKWWKWWSHVIQQWSTRYSSCATCIERRR